MKMLKKPNKIPKTSGIYFFKDSRGKIIYIGKAANLKSRLLSYFDKQEKPLKVRQILDRATSVDWQETDSEIEALILESQLIKKSRPEFNILMRDDKQYFYVVITKEVFSKTIITHRPDFISKKIGLPVKTLAKEGPFTDGGALRTTLRLLRKVFPYCNCKQKHNNYCLNYHIGNCPGFCCLKPRENDLRFTNKELRMYEENIKAIKSILSGKRKLLIKKLQKEMRAAAAKHDFKKAVEIRDQIAKLEKTFENARVINQMSKRGQGLVELKSLFGLDNAPARIEAYDISNIQGRFAVGSMVVFENGQSNKGEYKKFKITTDVKADDTGMIKEVLRRRFKHTEWQYPDLVLIDGGRAQIGVAIIVIKEFGLKIPVIGLTKDARHKGHHIFSGCAKKSIQLSEIPEPVKNLILQIDDEAHRFAISYYRKLHSDSLKLE